LRLSEPFLAREAATLESLRFAHGLTIRPGLIYA